MRCGIMPLSMLMLIFVVALVLAAPALPITFAVCCRYASWRCGFVLTLRSVFSPSFSFADARSQPSRPSPCPLERGAVRLQRPRSARAPAEARQRGGEGGERAPKPAKPETQPVNREQFPKPNPKSKTNPKPKIQNYLFNV